MGKKMKFDVNKLIELKLLRKIPQSIDKAKESIETAKKWLKEAEENFQNKTFNSCMLSCYLVMFHSARAILFKDGFREKSHFAIARYLEAVYVNKNLLEKKWIDLLDHYREIRHEDQYSTAFFVTEGEARNALTSAKEFLGRMEKLFES